MVMVMVMVMVKGIMVTGLPTLSQRRHENNDVFTSGKEVIMRGHWFLGFRAGAPATAGGLGTDWAPEVCLNHALMAAVSGRLLTSRS